jgi:lipoprotein signal peptidase
MAASTSASLRSRWPYFAIALTLLVADLATKSWAVEQLATPVHPLVAVQADGATPLAALVARGVPEDMARRHLDTGAVLRLRRERVDASARIGSELVGREIVVTEGTRQPAPRRIRLGHEHAGQTVAAVLAAEWQVQQAAVQALLDRAGWSVSGRGMAVDAPWGDTAAIALIDRNVPIAESWFQFVYAENKGAAFSFLHDAPPLLRLSLFVLISAIASIGLCWWLARGEGTVWMLAALAGILGGAVGNLISRVRHTVVVDFIYNYVVVDGTVHGWPVYNVADIGITCGVIAIALESLLRKPPPAGQTPAAS